MAPIKLVEDREEMVNPICLSDEESYIEEEIDSEEETVQEEIDSEEELEKVVSDHDEEETAQVGGEDYMDDSSSAPPPSTSDSDSPVIEGYTSHANRSSASEISVAARIADGVAEVDNEKTVRRQAARAALLRETHLQEETLNAMEQVERGGRDPEEIVRIGIQKQLLVARRRLAEEIERMDIKMSKKKRGIGSDQPPPSTAELEKRKKALAELRRQAAFQELARNNIKLKAEKAARSVASASTISSVEHRLHSPGVKKIKAVEICQYQVPISPLKAKDDSFKMNMPASEALALAPSSGGPERKERIPQSTISPKSQASNGRTNKENSGQSDGSNSRSPLKRGSRSSLTKQNVDPGSIPTMFRASFVKVMGGEVGPEMKGGIQSSATTTGAWRRNHSSIEKKVNPQSIPTLFQTAVLAKPTTVSTSPLVRYYGKFYALADLQAQRVEGIDNTGREQYLSPEDFLATFSMTKEEFAKLPKWKRDKAKTTLNLF